ncbi:MAG: pyruvate, phosphate dikinase [Deltaproteobacteria bacterium GWA2_38_16]|nr:MAG: pyruvate, phosphate dikinase [Deltaproteobacteria bacterium GWA2_38_16]OGQ01955.1 MAG: pyruvate, phosphate dikinase [Deltaproteobacteria bacterium RIFCSPHIGHO2_02_FULL_38_15]OGQ60079.1 MAG: pyruvate, phosphate dikinase [Deltaproteobacteria bacterium RIFCSPLOWO2_12_FULL_38_8]HBQ21300.1 pyruvate, phosphate dikinase [Deltaproteobacteria bacterium]
MSKPYVYFFGNSNAEGDPARKDILGGKGSGLAEMTKLSIPVPPGFTISTEVCSYFYEHNNHYPEGLEKEVLTKLSFVEEVLGTKFGDIKNPLLVSVRSGARISMPGMMDTILNLGLNDKTIEGLIAQTQKERFAYDSYRRFIQMYSNVVLDIDIHKFEALLSAKKKKAKVTQDVELNAQALKELVGEYKQLVKKTTGKEFPQDPFEQLWGAIGAVFHSWNSPRAITYRKIHHIPSQWGTAVNVQAMVFGNLGDDSATGVAFTRDPSTGDKEVFGEYLLNAQGEDVVAGIRTPSPLLGDAPSSHSLEKTMPKACKELCDFFERLEKHYKDMQDVEFTIQKGKVWILQTRRGKRSAKAAVRIAFDMVQEKMISQEEAILRIEPAQLEQLLHPMIDPEAPKEVIAKGLAASPGAVSGEVVFSPETAEKWVEGGHKVILVRAETSAEDIHGMHVASGILTARGGMTSHAAVVARGMGKCCIVGCHDIQIDSEHKYMMVNDKKVHAGDLITINGTTGEVYLGVIPTVQPKLDQYYEKLMTWVDEVRSIRVRANADTPHDAKVARQFGAEGIGLCRTEHMFFDPERIDVMREMILADTEETRRTALSKLLPMQKQDFMGIFKEMKGYPVTIRLLDPPLHEFLPQTSKDLAELAHKINVSFSKIKQKAKGLSEFNPMLGFRGCRLGVAYPEIYEMQVQAIMEAACEMVQKEKMDLIPEIMIPIVGDVKEFDLIKERVVKICKEVLEKYKLHIDYKVGTMIELPRAALTADQIAKSAEFFSFGTNDLTQTTFGISRDDSGHFLPKYIETGIYDVDPFVSIDQKGVGRLIEMAVELGRKTTPDLKIGICGEHGGDPSSVEFCYRTKLNYVSCSPYRVPVARLAAAQAVLKK